MSRSFVFLSYPKPFVGQTLDQQNQAISSWQALNVNKQIMLLGSEYGTSEAAQRFQCAHTPDPLLRDVFNAPYLSTILRNVSSIHSDSILVYVEPDCILHSEFASTLLSLEAQFSDFFASANKLRSKDNQQRVDFKKQLNLEDLRNYEFLVPRESAVMVFSAGAFGYHPPVTVSYPFRELWYLAEAVQLDLPTIDISLPAWAVQLQSFEDDLPLWGTEFRMRRSPEFKSNILVCEGTEALDPTALFSHKCTFDSSLQDNDYFDPTCIDRLLPLRSETLRNRCQELLSNVRRAFKTGDVRAYSTILQMLFYVSKTEPNYYSDLVKVLSAACYAGLGDTSKLLSINPNAIVCTEAAYQLTIFRSLFLSETSSSHSCEVNYE